MDQQNRLVRRFKAALGKIKALSDFDKIKNKQHSAELSVEEVKEDATPWEKPRRRSSIRGSKQGVTKKCITKTRRKRLRELQRKARRITRQHA